MNIIRKRTEKYEKERSIESLKTDESIKEEMIERRDEKMNEKDNERIDEKVVATFISFTKEQMRDVNWRLEFTTTIICYFF